MKLKPLDIILPLLGVLTLSYTIFNVYPSLKTMNWVKTDAIIKSIETIPNSRGSSNRDSVIGNNITAIYEYSVNGNIYTGNWNITNTFMNQASMQKIVNSSITIVYNPNQVNQSSTNSSFPSVLIFPFLLGIFLIVFPIVYRITHRSKQTSS